MSDRTAWNSTLRPGKPLARKQGLDARKAWLKRKTRLNPINRKRRQKRMEKGEVYGPFHRWVSGQACIAFRRPGECFGSTVGHHIRTVGAGGKDADGEVPICHKHHTELHQKGRDAFEWRYGVDLEAEAAYLLKKYEKERGDEVPEQAA